MLEARTVVPERVLQGSAHTTAVTFYSEGVAADPGVVTVSLEREDGTSIAIGQATGGSGNNPRTFALTPALYTNAVDVLKLSWVSPALGTLTTYVEVVGGFLFTTADARALKPLDSVTKYPNASIWTARSLAEVALEDACGVAFVPRYAREKIDGNGGVDLLLPDPRPLSVESAEIGGAAVIVGDIELYRDGRLYYASKWPEGRRNVEVKYTHGYAVAPPRVGRACLLLAKRFLVDSPIDDRVIQHTNEDGVSQLWMTAGVRGQVFDVPECVAVVQEYGYSQSVG